MPDSDMRRHAVPGTLERWVVAIVAWMRVLAFAQIGLVACAVVTVAAVLHWARVGLSAQPASLTLVATGVVLVLWVRQLLLLNAAADHFADVRDEPEHAHDHLVLAFTRLRALFAWDVVFASMVIVVLVWMLGDWGADGGAR